jgi:hypothetical protein
MSVESPIDVRDIYLVHRAFRSGFAESASLVRAHATPSAARVSFLANHIDFAIRFLHIHHEGEDAMLYPLIEARVPDQAANAERVDQEHLVVSDTADAVSAACSAWRTQPTAETGQALAVALTPLEEILNSHLDDEERDIVPLAAITLSQHEWNAPGERGIAQIPRKLRPIAFGMLTDLLNETDKAFMTRALPAPIKLFYGAMIQRPWTK